MLGERPGGRVATAQVLGAGLVAKAAGVDHAPDARRRAHLREGVRGAPLARLEVAALAATHRVHEVVRHVEVTRSLQRWRDEHVALVQIQARVTDRQAARAAAVAHERAHVRAVVEQAAHERAADEARRARHEYAHRTG